MSKFSPGPWRWTGETQIRDAKDELVMGIEHPSQDRRHWAPNRRLIAAAPEMYALLRDFLQNYGFGEEPDDKIRALLTRIDGE